LRLPSIYPILDTTSIARTGLTAVTVAEALLEGGAGILQFRHKAFWNRQILREAELIARLCREAGAQFIVNDRADYAVMTGAGLHLGQEDIAPRDARRVTGLEATIGFSTHSPEQMRAAQEEPVDYVAFGPVFATLSKERPDATVGIEGLGSVRSITALPLVAIGGITLDNAPLCWKAGADSVAVISGLTSGVCTKAELMARMIEWQQVAPVKTEA
jgi:thiamine-phosphate pyrophosphorylase